jgi:hypothetical protein
MRSGALREVAGILDRHRNVGVVLKSYALFGEDPARPDHEIRYFSEEREFAAGTEAIRVCFRRSGVISGYIVHRDTAFAAATDKFDGTLYYQMQLTANVLADRCAVSTPAVLVACRMGQLPEFGSSLSEKGKFVPGKYTPEARLSMVSGVLAIIRNLCDTRGVDAVDAVTRDCANYFYPYIKDQLNLPVRQYLALYRRFSRMGFRRYPLFHIYFVMGYLLGERQFDGLTRVVRARLGRSPQFL